MKQKLIKLFILFVVMSVLTSSSKDCGTSKSTPALNDEQVCTDTPNSFALTISCTQEVMAVQEKNDEARVASLADNEISLSPISRFILVQ